MGFRRRRGPNSGAEPIGLGLLVPPAIADPHRFVSFKVFRNPTIDGGILATSGIPGRGTVREERYKRGGD